MHVGRSHLACSNVNHNKLLSVWTRGLRVRTINPDGTLDSRGVFNSNFRALLLTNWSDVIHPPTPSRSSSFLLCILPNLPTAHLVQWRWLAGDATCVSTRLPVCLTLYTADVPVIVSWVTLRSTKLLHLTFSSNFRTTIRTRPYNHRMKLHLRNFHIILVCHQSN